MTIKEMVNKAYDAANEMAESLDRFNSSWEDGYEQERREAYEHFGLIYDGYKPTPYLSREEFIEAEAQVFLKLLLKKEQVDNQAKFVYERNPKLKVNDQA